MARSSSTADVFTAVAEPHRRQILTLLATGERPVNDIVAALDQQAQPQVSKHLRVLREVGLVAVRGAGQQRVYRLTADKLEPIRDWVMSFELFSGESFDRLGEYLEEIQKEEKDDRKTRDRDGHVGP